MPEIERENNQLNTLGFDYQVRPLRGPNSSEIKSKSSEEKGGRKKNNQAQIPERYDPQNFKS